MSRRIARIHISGDRRPLQDAWNAMYPDRLMIAGAIAVDAGTSEYTELRRLYDLQSPLHPMEWNERVETVFSQTDLEDCEILTLWVSGSAGPGGNTYGRVYENIATCPRCGNETLGRQIAPLHLDGKTLEETDLGVTDYWELVCSERFRTTLTESGIAGVQFAPALSIDGDGGDRHIFQMSISARLGPLSRSVPLARENRCELCGEYRSIGLDAPGGDGRLLRFPRSSYHGEAIAHTQERLGATRKFPLSVISQPLHRLLATHGLSGWQAEPAHLEDSD